MKDFAGKVADRIKKANQVAAWLAEPSSCLQSNEVSSECPSNTHGNSETLFTIPAASNLLPLKRRPSWGYICKYNSKFPLRHLYKHEETFGRSSLCDFTYNGKDHGIELFIGSISSHHFTLHYCAEHTYLVDHSTHGTFVNGTRVTVAPNGRKQVLLENGNRISVVMDNGPGIFFYSSNEKMSTLITQGMPSEITTNFHVDSRLGKGASGQVYLIKDKFTLNTFALKVIEAKANGMNAEKYIKSEIAIITSLQHDYIVELDRIISHTNKTYIIMEHMNGSLSDMLNTPEGLSVEAVQLLAYQMLLALEYLHAKNIIHRDLKPANILTCTCSIASVKFKLADFGLSKHVTLSQAANTFCGSRAFMAPEYEDHDRQGGFTTGVDIWSLGATLYYSVCRELYNKTFGAVNFSGDIWKITPWQARKCIEMMLTWDPTKRPCARELLDCSWFQNDKFKKLKQTLQAPVDSRVLQNGEPQLQSDASLKSSDRRLSLGSRPSKPYFTKAKQNNAAVVNRRLSHGSSHSSQGLFAKLDKWELMRANTKPPTAPESAAASRFVQ